MTVKAPFYPKYGSGQNATAAAASASITLGKGNKQIRIANTGLNPFQFRIGVGAQTATLKHFNSGLVANDLVGEATGTVAAYYG